MVRHLCKTHKMKFVDARLRVLETFDLVMSDWYSGSWEARPCHLDVRTEVMCFHMSGSLFSGSLEKSFKEDRMTLPSEVWEPIRQRLREEAMGNELEDAALEKRFTMTYKKRDRSVSSDSGSARTRPDASVREPNSVRYGRPSADPRNDVEKWHFAKDKPTIGEQRETHRVDVEARSVTPAAAGSARSAVRAQRSTTPGIGETGETIAQARSPMRGVSPLSAAITMGRDEDSCNMVSPCRWGMG